jgi:hypothetical protein
LLRVLPEAVRSDNEVIAAGLQCGKREAADLVGILFPRNAGLGVENGHVGAGDDPFAGIADDARDSGQIGLAKTHRGEQRHDG